jgi:hypothetical protein
MNYLHNKDLYIEIVVSKAQGKLTKNAKLMLELLAKKTIKKMRYWSTDDKMDCYQGGLLDMFANWYNFNEEKSDGNAFAYFTEIFKRGLAKSFNELYKKKGDPTHSVKLISLEGSNDGQGLHSI